MIQDVLWWGLSRVEPLLHGSWLRKRALKEVMRLVHYEVSRFTLSLYSATKPLFGHIPYEREICRIITVMTFQIGWWLHASLGASFDLIVWLTFMVRHAIGRHGPFSASIVAKCITSIISPNRYRNSLTSTQPACATERHA